jgi:hypothetical protein
MKLLPNDLRAQIPTLYQTRHEADPMVWVKFFAPVLPWRWYIIECEQIDRLTIFYGWMVSTGEPHGRFIRTDVASMRAYFGITITRDLEFVACRLSEVQRRERGGEPQKETSQGGTCDGQQSNSRRTPG